MKYGLTSDIIRQIQIIFKKYPQIESVILYGSRAKGNFRPGSDIDLTLKGSSIDLHLLAKISNDLDDLSIPYQCDVSIFVNIKDVPLLNHITTYGIEFYKKGQSEPN